MGSLSYRLVAKFAKYSIDSWEILASKLLLNFKGCYNVSVLEFDPSIDCKQFMDGRISSTLTLNKPVLLVRRDTVLTAMLELEGIRDYKVDIVVTFQRKTQIGENVKTENLSRQKKKTNVRKDIMAFEWNLDFPLISTATYVNELTPMYSVRYFVKVSFRFQRKSRVEITFSTFFFCYIFQYSISFKQLNDGAACTDGQGEGIVEVKVGTTFENSSDPSKITDHLEKLTLESRRSSVTSMLTLPPAYSELSSRTESVMSLETRKFESHLSTEQFPNLFENLTEPPSYDDVDEAETSV